MNASSRPRAFACLLCATFGLILATVGCQKDPTAPGAATAGSGLRRTSATPKGVQRARELIGQMVQAYRDCSTYADAGQLLVYVDQPGGRQRELPPAPLVVAYERPNRLRVQAFMANVVCDGKSLLATTEELEGQVLSQKAPSRLSLDDLAGDPMLAGTLSGGVGLAVPQLTLLLADDAADRLLPADGALSVADERETIDGKEHFRLEVTAPAGKTTYWIDAQSFVLRRMEFPAPKEMKENLAQQGPAEGVRVVADLVGAQFGRPPSAGAFEFQTPSAAKLVRRFVPPPPDPPPAALGQNPPEFTLVDQSGEKISSTALANKYAVLFYWIAGADNPESCQRGLADMARMSSHLEDDTQLFAVNADDARFPQAQVTEALSTVTPALAVLRDADAAWRTALQLPGLFPAVVILAPDGEVAYIHVGYEPHLDEAVLAALGKLRAGEDLADASWQKYQSRRAEHDRQMAAVLVGSTQSLEIPPTKVAQRSEPKALAMTQAWNQPLQSPGNILVQTDADGGTRVFVLEGSRTLVECQIATGEIKSRQELEIPEGVAVSFLRTALDDEGRRWYVAFASTAQELYVFDERWQRTARYPDSPSAGLADVRFAALGGEAGLGLVVSYFGQTGLQGVSLDGQRLWSDRRLENVLSVAPVRREAGQRPILWCASGRDGVWRLSDPKAAPSLVPLPKRSIVALLAADLVGDAPDELCAISAAGLGQFSAIGLDENGKELWQYELPAGVHSQPIEWLTFGQLQPSGSAQWMVAAADGSIHILTGSGELVDRFSYGSVLCGLATAAIDSRPVLLVASVDGGLTAWTVEPSSPLK